MNKAIRILWLKSSNIIYALMVFLPETVAFLSISFAIGFAIAFPASLSSWFIAAFLTAIAILAWKSKVSWGKSHLQLPALSDVKQLSPRVWHILGKNPGKFTLQGTNCYLVGTGQSKILIDTSDGGEAWIASIKRAMEESNCQNITDVIITHRHPDHTGGIEHLKKVSKGFTVWAWAQPTATSCCTKNKDTFSYFRMIWRSNDFGLVSLKKYSSLSQNQEITTEGATLRILHTPGHTPDSISILLEEERAFFTGDTILGNSTPIFSDLHMYCNSLRTLMRFCPTRIYPGHGVIIENGSYHIRSYIDHRMEREKQILDVLSKINKRKSDGVASKDKTQDKAMKKWAVEEIVEQIYKNTPKSLHFAASSVVQQHLEKLLKENRVNCYQTFIPYIRLPVQLWEFHMESTQPQEKIPPYGKTINSRNRSRSFSVMSSHNSLSPYKKSFYRRTTSEADAKPNNLDMSVDVCIKEVDFDETKEFQPDSTVRLRSKTSQIEMKRPLSVYAKRALDWDHTGYLEKKMN